MSDTAFTEPDFADLRELLARVTAADGVSPINEATQLAGNRRDRLGVAPGVSGVASGVSGVALSIPGDTVWETELCVDPPARNRGVGRALVTAVSERARAAGASALRLWAHGNLPAARALAAATGCRLARELFLMEAPLTPANTAAPELPAGYAVREFDPHPRDMRTWVEVNARAFADHPEQGALTLDDLRARIAQEWFRPRRLLLLEHRGTAVGYVWVKQREIYAIGVVPGHHGRGLGRALTQRGLAVIAADGHDTAELYVDGSNRAARALYRRLGFVDRFADAQYERDL